jgi:SET domain
MLALQQQPQAALAPLQYLTAANLARCEAAVTTARKDFPKLVPATVSTAAAARVLAVLNTNSHELEELEGSGLFLLACVMEHDCRPNCSFTTFGDTLYMTAVQRISAGDRISIDYGKLLCVDHRRYCNCLYRYCIQ